MYVCAGRKGDGVFWSRVVKKKRKKKHWILSLFWYSIVSVVYIWMQRLRREKEKIRYTMESVRHESLEGELEREEQAFQGHAREREI